jgi:tRNA-Thr(GGU) m(6)t(6)A37 methyltransferase TsaA
MKIEIKPIAWVKNSRKIPIDDNWSEIISEIELDESLQDETLNSITDFSHLEILYYFNKVKEEDIVLSGHPRGNKNYPLVGIFAQRKKDRPNKIGLCTVELLKHDGRKLIVKNLDAIDGSPVLDIKPVFKDFQPQGQIRQPFWVKDLMKNYW